MDLWQALVLGVVEGLTEFLPVSSTGHLLVTQRALGLPATAASHAYAICIQAGAVAAVLVLYAARVRQVAAGLVGRDAAGARLARSLLVAFLPAAVAGLALDDVIEARLFGAWPVVGAWIAGGVLILLLGPGLRRRTAVGQASAPGGAARGLDALRPRDALLIGLAQVLALWPGTSRSLVTILAAALVGLTLPAAIEFSFLLGVLTLGAATAFKLLQHGRGMLESLGAGAMAAGFLAAAVAAVVAVRWMVGYLARHDLRLFGWWRIAAGVAVGALLVTGVL